MFIRLKKRLNYIRNGVVRLLEFETIIKTQQLLTTLAMKEFDTMTTKKGANERELIVSLTTFGKRIHNVHLVIQTIALQTVLPTKVLLWLDEDEFEYDDLPLTLIVLLDKGLEINFCENMRSYKKLIPTLIAHPEANVITIDDDILYPLDMIELLVREHKKYPDFIVGHRAHRIKNNTKGKLLPYLQWDLETQFDGEGYDIFITTGAGTLFPARCFSSEVLNVDAFLDICPNADDIWFKAMSFLNGVKCKKIADSRKYSNRFFTLPDDQDIGLYNSNISEAQNDYQIRNVFNRYGIKPKSLG
jgi:hypothetical protein